MRHFDTADIYGQGDSERFLAQWLGDLPESEITTKAGQRFPFAKRIVLRAKPLLRPLMARRGMAQAASANRAGLLPQDWSERHLRTALEGSLRRLQRDAVDNFMLHSPSAEVLRQGEAMDVLHRVRIEGKARRIGASIDDAAAFAAAVADRRMGIIQLPSLVLLAEPELAARAREAGVIIVVREIFAAVSGHDVRMAINAVRSSADVILIGTSNPDHLREAHVALAGGAPC